MSLWEIMLLWLEKVVLCGSKDFLIMQFKIADSTGNRKNKALKIQV